MKVEEALAMSPPGRLAIPVIVKFVDVPLVNATELSEDNPGTISPPFRVVRPVTCSVLLKVEEALAIKPFCRMVRPVMVPPLSGK